MDLGVAFPASTTVWDHVALAEAVGYGHAWLDDSQMLFSDPYVSLALCARATERIRLGVGVTNPSTRVAPVTANAIATVNRLASGRTMLGIGTGNTSLRAMGLPAARVATLRRHIVDVRALLTGPAAADEIRFLDPDGGWIDVASPIPIFVAGSGPRVLELAGELGDAVILFGTVDPGLLATSLARVGRGAERAGRDSGRLPVMCMTTFCELQDGEAATSPRALQRLGPFVSSAANLLAVSNPDPAELPAQLRGDLLRFRDIYRASAAAGEGESPYAGYARGLRADVAEHITEAIVRATTLTGTAREIRSRLREMEQAGVSMVAIRPVVDIPDTIRGFAAVARAALPV